MKEERLYEEVRYNLEDLKTVFCVGVYFSKQEYDKCMEHLEELASLAQTYGFEVLKTFACPMKKYDSATYIGSGKVEEILAEAEKMGAAVLIFDDEITPNQQRNLEKIFKRPIIDRTELILEVFAKRAQTKEATLQIELAKSRYQLPRLKRLWTHLSRESAGGGGGYLRGAGEKQIEMDRRMVKDRIAQLRKEIEDVQRQRHIQRSKRMRSGIPAFAVVGYTNAGKSTLFNALTEANVLVEDKLFATLDTTTRQFTLPNHQNILLIDTVGFIRKIPHTLVAAFKSTLEEAVYTDIILHVLDVSHPCAHDHAAATLAVLKELKADEIPRVTILNKIDKCQPNLVNYFRSLFPKTVAVSALTKEGFEDLLDLMIEEIKRLRKVVTLRIPQSHYALVSLLMEEGKVLETEYEGNDILMKVEIPAYLEKRVLPFESRSV